MPAEKYPFYINGIDAGIDAAAGCRQRPDAGFAGQFLPRLAKSSGARIRNPPSTIR
jgi:hypothetical protein